MGVSVEHSKYFYTYILIVFCELNTELKSLGVNWHTHKKVSLMILYFLSTFSNFLSMLSPLCGMGVYVSGMSQPYFKQDGEIECSHWHSYQL